MMQLVQDFLQPNDLIRSQGWSLARELIDRYLISKNQPTLLDHVRLLHVSPNYIDWTPTTDILGYVSVKELHNLKHDACTFLLFDQCLEGFSSIHDQPYISMLYHNADSYQIPCHKIFFVSSNIKDDSNLLTVSSDRLGSSINVISTTALEFSMRDAIFGSYVALDRLLIDPFEFFKTKFVKSYQGKWFSSLSRIVKPHRAIATYLLGQSQWAHRAIISHDRIDSNILEWEFFRDLDSVEALRWQATLPIVADTEDFSINQAMNINGHIHFQTLFQIVNETMVDSKADTSLFFSEKTFKPIGHLQPFVIYGQPGCNRALADLGYELYTDWFNYDFDDEPNHIKRYKMLLQSVERACLEIDSLPQDQLIDWRYKNKQVLKHNFTTFKQAKFAMHKTSQIVDRLIELTT